MATGDSSDLDLVPVSARAPQPEQRLFGRFTLKRVLGRGGMGIVWLASDEELQRSVAMKFLPDMLIRDPDAVKDLKRETRRSLDLTHHHIVRIYDFIQDDSSAAIVMEYVDGESLSAMKSKRPGGCFGPSEIGHWVAHFCMAMDYAHNQARVVHRDLKPANLMLNSRSELKVTDFGISRSLSDSMTRVSLANNAGTLAYMSPEQALGSPPAPADDIYAFGATLYDLLTGRPPFFRGNLQVQLETVMPPPLMQRRRELDNEAEEVPPDWEEVIMACLAKRPEDRPRTLGEAGQRLGVLGTTGMRTAPLVGGADLHRATPTNATTPGVADGPPTAQQVSADSPKTPTSGTKALRHTTLDDILGYGADRTVPAVPVPSPARPPTSPAQPQPPSEEAPEMTLPVKPVEGAGSSASSQKAESPPVSPTPPASSAARSISVPVTSPARGGTPWVWIGAVGIVVVAAAIALAWPKGKGKIAHADATPVPAAATVSESVATPEPAVAAAPVQPPVDPAVEMAARHVSTAEEALESKDLLAAKREIAAIEQIKPDYAALAGLKKRLGDVQQEMFTKWVADAQKAISERNIPDAKEAIAKAADIQDGEAVDQLRASLKKLETPPATPAPVAVAPAATPAPPPTVDKPESEPKPSVASTRPRPQDRPKVEPKAEPKVEPKRPTPRPVVQTAPEPKPTPKPAVQSQTPPKPQTPRKVFSIPGS